MDEDIPELVSRPPSPAEKRVMAIYDQIATGQLEVLDQAAKRFIELITALFGLIFAVLAFGKDFPPAYLAADTGPWAVGIKILLFASVAVYLLALALALLALRPRRWPFSPYDVAGNQGTLDAIATAKLRLIDAAGALFWLASAAFAASIGVIILRA